MDSILITTWSFCLFFLSSLVTWNRCLICILLRSRSVDRAIANMLCGRISAIEAAVAAESATFDDTEITVLCCIHSGTVARCLLHDTGKCTYSIFISIISVSHSRISDSCRYRWMPSYECLRVQVQVHSTVEQCGKWLRDVSIFLVFLFSFFYGLQEALQPDWASILISAYYPLLLTCSSLVVCLWAEVSLIATHT